VNIDIKKVNEYNEIIFNGVLLNMENCENLIYVISSLNTNNRVVRGGMGHGVEWVTLF